MRAVIYCRVSTKEQAQNLSLPTQLRACRDYCEREGYEVAKVFIDAGESAKTIDRLEGDGLIYEGVLPRPKGAASGLYFGQALRVRKRVPALGGASIAEPPHHLGRHDGGVSERFIGPDFQCAGEGPGRAVGPKGGDVCLTGCVGLL